ncbi:MAG: D-TA family PLP-dependent enzyme [Acidobacteria bacterium]|nr:D-TA family PLP-dependent enzyme [Acidobacteriota bacterium]
MRIEELDTPAVIVDLDVLEKNIQSLADYCRQYDLNLRPHTKTHKIPEIAKLQIKAGCSGITVAKVGEAEVMAAAGLQDILVAYPVLGEAKTTRLAQIALNRKITVSLDSLEVAEGLSVAARKAGSHLDILLEFDAGIRRCGVETPAGLVALGHGVAKLPNLHLVGVLFYPGHIWVSPEEQGPVLEQLSERVQTMLEAMRTNGLNCQTVSGGSTPSAYNSHRVKGVTEIRAGTFVFNDRNELGLGVCRLEQCALRVLTTVVSCAVSGRAVIDGGSKTFSGDHWLSGDKKGFGVVVEHPDVQFVGMSEEHGNLDLVGSSYRPRIGDRLTVIPNHVCPCVNMHDRLYFHRNGVVEETWAVAGRGRVQ